MKKYMLTLMIFLLFPFSSTAYADGTFGDGGWHMIGGGWLMWLLWLIVAGVVVYVLVDRSRQQKSDNTETSLEILQKRYARGEISKEEYEQMKLDLT